MLTKYEVEEEKNVEEVKSKTTNIYVDEPVLRWGEPYETSISLSSVDITGEPRRIDYSQYVASSQAALRIYSSTHNNRYIRN